MFILESSPWFVIPLGIAGVALMAVFIVLGMSALFDDQDNFKNKKSVICSIILFVFAANSAGISIYGASQKNSVEETFNNPYSVNEEDRDNLRVQTSEIEKSIEEAIELDKVQIDETREISNYIKQGDMVDFEAVEEGKLVEGKFYFTENSLEILTTGESDIVEHVSIPTDE